MIASGQGDFETVKFFVQQKLSDFDMEREDGATALLCACEAGHFDIARFLVAQGADVNAKGESYFPPILYACNAADFKMVEYLVMNGADATDALSHICKQGSLEMVKYLVGHGADLTKKRNLLVKACESGNLELVKYLVGKAAWSWVGKYGNTCLMAASSSGNVEMIKYLLKQKKDSINEKNEVGISALGLACNARKIEAIKYLISNGADVNAEDRYGNSIIINAHASQYEDVVEMLGEAGAEDYDLIKAVAQRVADDICTANGTLDEVGQHIYYCRRCRSRCCIVCSDLCHGNHDVIEDRYTPFGLLSCPCSDNGVCKTYDSDSGD